MNRTDLLQAIRKHPCPSLKRLPLISRVRVSDSSGEPSPTLSQKRKSSTDLPYVISLCGASLYLIFTISTGAQRKLNH